ncbi:MAG: glycosyltransferase [Anaerolineales bacterium]|nr:glycosyltransferase [Anaerolineales bacterium]
MTQENRQANEYQHYKSARQAHWDALAKRLDHWRGWGGYYHKRLVEIYRHLIAPGQTVLEIGCGEGDLLAKLEPALGVGIDLSLEMVRRAKRRHPNLDFIQADAHQMCLDKQFDFIILSDLLNDLWDVQDTLTQISHLSHPRTRVILNSYNRLWEIPLAVAARLGLAKPNLFQNWLTVEDIDNLLYLSNFEVIRNWEEILWPLPTPIVDSFCNRFLVRLWPFRHFALTNMIVARPFPEYDPTDKTGLVSVVVPARNEAGNIEEIFRRVPEMGGGTELIFVEGHSKDNTYEAIEEAIKANPNRACKLFRQEGEGKGNAVRLGFKHASGEILMILDADLTVPPEDLPLFHNVLISRKGDFANGVRLVYPLEDEAMRFFNLVGNKFFSIAFSWLFGQTIKDTLCGTKVLRKDDYELIAANRSYFGDFDPFGDFDLLLGAVKQNMKITDVPIRYKRRVYGSTNIQRWKHGWLLIRMLVFAARRLKFV